MPSSSSHSHQRIPRRKNPPSTASHQSSPTTSTNIWEGEQNVSSFHGSQTIVRRCMTETSIWKTADSSHLRTQTAPDLLRLFDIFQCNTPDLQPPARMPIIVNLLGSIHAIRLLVAFDASVQDVINASLKAYVKEGRLPHDGSRSESYGLHYSQFCLESIQPEEPISRLGARSFFLCPVSSTREMKPIGKETHGGL